MSARSETPAPETPPGRRMVAPLSGSDAARYRPYPAPAPPGSSSNLPHGFRGSVEPTFNGLHPAIVDTISTRQSLSGAQRMDVHRFSKCDPLIQSAELHAHLISQDNKLTAIEQLIEKVKVLAEGISEGAAESWTPTKWHKDLMRGSAYHYLTFPMDSYLMLFKAVELHFAGHPEALDIAEHKSNEVVQKKVVGEIRQQCNDAKSRFKKLVDTSMDSKMPLVSFTEDMLQKFRQGYNKKEPISVQDKALFASYRDVAFRIQQKHTTNSTPDVLPSGTNQPDATEADAAHGRTLRADSGFWKAVDDEYAVRLKVFEDSENPGEKWSSWMAEVIAQDGRRFSRPLARSRLGANAPMNDQGLVFGARSNA
ncbi:hypothetical protein FRC09_007322 [Ceratobasidium sp. 395]|nr:hypothetical protein FRC09_007322 [Ceratobasidium sp. 395]